MVSGVRYQSIDERGITIIREDSCQESELIEVDSIVICAGQVSDRRLADELKRCGREAHVIGGAFRAAELDAKNAIAQGSRLAAAL